MQSGARWMQGLLGGPSSLAIHPKIKTVLHGGADLWTSEVQSGIQEFSLEIPGEGSGGIPIDVHWLQSAEDPPASKGHGGGIREKLGGYAP